MTIESDINQFCSYFEKRLGEIRALDDPLFKKILLVAMFDTLARVPCPEEKSKKRFLGFIERFVDWDEKNKVSISQLSHYLENQADSGLKIEVKKRLENWHESTSLDPAYEEITAFAKTTDERRSVDEAKHTVLLYTYRCKLVHEFRQAGQGLEFSKENEVPFYHPLTDLGTGNETWELTYPENFFFHIVESALRNLKIHLLAENKNPYDSFTFGSAWRKE